MFGRKQKKLDPRVRFQHQTFTRKLEQARSYKRDATAVPEDWQGYLLAKLGLNTRLSQIIAVLVLLLVIYIIFIPNFLSVKTINVVGLGENDTKLVQADVSKYLAEAPFFLAQHNLIFLSKTKLSRFLLTDQKIYQVKKIDKHLFSRSLVVTVNMKTPRYLVKHNEQIYSVYNDGTIQEQLAQDPAQWLTTRPELIKLDDQSNSDLNTNKAFLNPNLINAIEQITSRYKLAINNDLDYFAVTEQTPLPLNPHDVTVWVKKPGNRADYRVLFTVDQNWDQAFAKLELLFSQMPTDRYNKLLYVDMRYQDRAFLCLTDAACAKEPEPVTLPAPAPIDTSTNQPTH